MREILFRGKPLGNWEWVYGFVVINKNGECFIKDTDYNINNGKCDLIPACVDPETIGQYTGKKDCNGKRIFEGDIVVARIGYCGYPNLKINERILAVEYSVRFVGYLSELSFGDVYEIEIIGNIHDNPELLEVG